MFGSGFTNLSLYIARICLTVVLLILLFMLVLYLTVVQLLFPY